MLLKFLKIPVAANVKKYWQCTQNFFKNTFQLKLFAENDEHRKTKQPAAENYKLRTHPYKQHTFHITKGSLARDWPQRR